MDNLLEKEITLLDDTQHDGYYPWCLRETLLDEETSCSEDYVPFTSGLSFTVSKMRLIRGLNFESNRDLINDGEFQARKETQELNIENNTGIIATLSPENFDDDGNLESVTRFSMFGTDRKIDRFELRISSVDSNDEERCFISGCVSYTTDFDYREETIPDTIDIVLRLSKDRFNNLAELISNRTIDIASIYLGDIDGVYSSPSPLSTTGFVKILTGGSKDQKINKPEGCDIEPPRLGRGISLFNLRFTTLYKSNSKQNDNTKYIKNLFESHSEQKADLTEFMVNQIISTSKINNSLRFISALLVLLLLSIWLK
jgi:hypothetical protein